LSSFVEVARHRSYTQAARALFLSQPTVYQHVRTLEKELRAPLVAQIGKTVTLTPQGRLLLPYANKILKDVHYVTSSLISEYDGLSAGSLRIAAGTTPGQSILPRALGMLRKQYPRIDLTLTVENSWRQLEDSLMTLGYDAAFASSAMINPELVQERVITDRLVLIAPNDHRLARLRTITPEQLLDLSDITYASTLPLHEAVDNWTGASRRSPSSTRFELGSQQAVLSAVTSGVGPAIVNAMVAEPIVTAGMLTAIELDPPIRRAIQMVRPANVPRSDALEKLVAIVKSIHNPESLGPLDGDSTRA